MASRSNNNKKTVLNNKAKSKSTSPKSGSKKSLAAGLISGKRKTPRMSVSSLTGGKKHKLDDLRKDLQPLVKRANEAIENLSEKGLLEESEAYQNAMRTHSRAKGVDQNKLFSLEDKKRYRDIVREANRLYAFLGAPDVSANVAAYNQKIHQDHGLSFKNQKEVFQSTGFRFASDDQDRTKLALRIYRDIASTEPMVIGKNVYDSDSLLNLIYDELEGYDPNAPEKDIDDLVTKAHDAAFYAVENFRQNTYWGFINGTSAEERDMGIIEELNKQQSAEDFLSARDLRKRNW